MSKKSMKLIDDLKDRLSYAIDNILEDDVVTGFIICEDSAGDILVGTNRAEIGSDLNLKCPFAFLKPKGTIIVSPTKK